MGMNPSLDRLAREQPIAWGILGTGNVAQLFASDLARVPDARFLAIGSRSKERARIFGQKFSVPNQHGSYRELANDPRVQAVYIATPASAHKENILLCLNSGKARSRGGHHFGSPKKGISDGGHVDSLCAINGQSP
ncbi:MAG: hypothetical protein DMG05_29520 [Acidobacteria bacterium]|nr:MAG: hypothetical protein DMG05_29520 [Acidobacteriota bacterium]